MPTTNKSKGAGVKVTNDATTPDDATQTGPAAVYVVASGPAASHMLATPTLFGARDASALAGADKVSAFRASFPHGQAPRVIVVETFDDTDTSALVPEAVVMVKRAEHEGARGRAAETLRVAYRVSGPVARAVVAGADAEHVATLKTLRPVMIDNPCKGAVATLKARHMIGNLRALVAGAAALGMGPDEIQTEHVMRSLAKLAPPVGSVWGAEAAPSEIREAARGAVALGLYASQEEAAYALASAARSLGVNVVGYDADADA